MEPYALRVTTFGEFTISVVNAPEESCGVVRAGGRSKKLFPFIQYLVINRDRALTVAELCHVFWPDESGDSSANALKILVHRARAELDRLGVYTGKDIIINQQGTYRWNSSIPTVVDCESFDRMYLEAIRKTGESLVNWSIEAINLYKGRFLPESTAYPWAASLNESFHLRFTEFCLNCANILDSVGRYDQLLALVEPALKLGVTVETLHVLYIRALSRTGQQEKALAYYRSICESWYIHYGKVPSEQLMSLYKDICADIRSFEGDVNLVLRSLPGISRPEGAMFCGLTVFIDILHFKIRESLDPNSAAQLALLTVSTADGDQPTKRVMDTVKKGLGNLLPINCAYTQYSMRQYLILLPETSREDGLKTVLSVTRKLRASLKRCDAVFQHSLTQLDPMAAPLLPGGEDSGSPS